MPDTLNVYLRVTDDPQWAIYFEGTRDEMRFKYVIIRPDEHTVDDWEALAAGRRDLPECYSCHSHGIQIDNGHLVFIDSATTSDGDLCTIAIPLAEISELLRLIIKTAVAARLPFRRDPSPKPLTTTELFVPAPAPALAPPAPAAATTEIKVWHEVDAADEIDIDIWSLHFKGACGGFMFEYEVFYPGGHSAAEWLALANGDCSIDCSQCPTDGKIEVVGDGIRFGYPHDMQSLEVTIPRSTLAEPLRAAISAAVAAGLQFRE